MADKQLRMDLHDLSKLPDVEMPEGYAIRTYQQGDEEAWAQIMNTGIGEWTAESTVQELTSKPQFLPDGLFFATINVDPVGSACAWRMSADEKAHGFLHMVCVLPEHRGKQLGYMVTLSVLRYFRDNGYKDVTLTTDDWRIPAIKSYLRLGFEPYYYDDSHRERWKAIMEKCDG
ncbi:MAG: GNAT family N-acetyltransferase [Armatimonadota bacterium]